MNAQCNIVFDWNGTLLDDLYPALAAHNAVLRMMGVDEISAERYQSDYNVPFIKMYESAGCEMTQLAAREKEVHATFHATYDEAVKAVPLRQGAEATLRFLRDAGAHIIVLSNHTVAAITAQAKQLGILGYFSAVLANDVNGVAYKKRGKDLRLKDYMQAHHLAGGFIVGDTIEEIEIGRDYDLQSFAITGGMCSTGRLDAEKPHHLITSLTEIQPILRQRGFA
jgi:phosphoglycolate phosphatase-like HAD superfamily hydrolase